MLIFALLLQGCGAILFPTQQEVPVDCTNVAVASFSVPAAGSGCRSGQVLRLDRRKDHAMEVRAEGYEVQTVRIVSEFSIGRAIASVLLNGSHGIFTLFITTVIGIGADIKAGAWQVLVPTEVKVELYRPGQGPSPTAQAGETTWPAASPSPSTYCSSCGVRAGTSAFCTSCGARIR
ncbi:MAG: hypothetical protein M9894_27415 [Planctomycetes bacterium]|nr:hypothetical protein [Planctomycetota bacterium]